MTDLMNSLTSSDSTVVEGLSVRTRSVIVNEILTDEALDKAIITDAVSQTSGL